MLSRTHFLESKYVANDSESSDNYSDNDEEDQLDYRVGGYHPVEVVLNWSGLLVVDWRNLQ